MTNVKVGLCAAIHPNMPGDDVGVYKKIINQMEPLKKDMDFDLVVENKPISFSAQACRMEGPYFHS